MEDNKTKNKGIKIIGLAAAFFLVIGITAGVTYSLLKTKTKTRENMFTSSGNISAKLTEDKWGTWNDSGTFTDGTGSTKAKNCTPGLNIEKNPKITNTSKVDEYVAIKLKYSIEDPGNAGTFIEVTYDTMKIFVKFMTGTEEKWGEGWIQDSTDKGKFYYSTDASDDSKFKKIDKVSGSNTATTELFQSVKIKDDNDFTTGVKFKNKDNSITYTCNALPNFKIEATGYAVQATDITGIKTQLDSLM